MHWILYKPENSPIKGENYIVANALSRREIATEALKGALFTEELRSELQDCAILSDMIGSSKGSIDSASKRKRIGNDAAEFQSWQKRTICFVLKKKETSMKMRKGSESIRFYLRKRKNCILPMVFASRFMPQPI